MAKMKPSASVNTLNRGGKKVSFINMIEVAFCKGLRNGGGKVARRGFSPTATRRKTFTSRI